MLKHYVAMQVWLATNGKNGKQRGQSLAEYGLILALIAVFCIAALTTLGQGISGMLQNLSSKITAAGGGGG